MKICIVTTAFPRWKGDNRAPFILEAARAVQRQGVQVKVIAVHSPGSKTHEFIDGIEVLRPRYLPERWELLQRESGGIPEFWRQNSLLRLILIPFFFVHTLMVAFHSRNYDLIHANWTLSGVSVWFTQFFHKRPFIVTLQGSDIYQAARMPFVRSITQKMLQKANMVLTLSRSLSLEAQKLGLETSQIEILPNGVDVNQFRMANKKRKPLLIFVGSLIERKGIGYLIQSMPGVIAKYPDVRLFLIGEGNLRSALSDLVNQLNLQENVFFVGPQPQYHVSDWLKRARVFILPSIEEGLGVVLLEALASGTPCIGSRVGGIQDIVTPDVGILVPPADALALEKAILSLLENDNYWQQLSIQARYKAENLYDWDKIGARLIKIYQNIIGYQK